jgi:hypothetical protein
MSGGEQTPLWRWLVVGLLCAGAALYFIASGEIAIDKKRTMIVTRAANPLGYWFMVSVCAALGAAALHKAWRRMFRE